MQYHQLPKAACCRRQLFHHSAPGLHGANLIQLSDSVLRTQPQPRYGQDSMVATDLGGYKKANLSAGATGRGFGLADAAANAVVFRNRDTRHIRSQHAGCLFVALIQHPMSQDGTVICIVRC